MPIERSWINRAIAFMCLAFAVGASGCADAPHGPYQFRDHSDTMRMGGDFIEMTTYKPGIKDEHLRPPKLLYPSDRRVFTHYPRELTYRWEPAEGTPPDVEYL